jgi:catechol 2,3-dioxygenase
MTTSTYSETEARTTIHPATRLGHVHYTVADLNRQVDFYTSRLGFRLHWRAGESAGLGAGGEDLLRLTERRGARRVRGTTGLYHTAFLVPSRQELAHLLRRIAITRTPIQGMTNHGTHHAIYLPDGEGNGIELAWDFPREQWPKSFEEMIRNRALTPDEVFSVLDGNEVGWDGLHPDTKLGHVHLHVSQLPETRHFYMDLLGFEIPAFLASPPPQFAESAIFFSAGGYHHHIGTNVWQGVGAPPPPPDATGLRYFTVVLPDTAEMERLVERVKAAGNPLEQQENGVLLYDPSGNGVVLTTG